MTDEMMTLKPLLENSTDADLRSEGPQDPGRQGLQSGHRDDPGSFGGIAPDPARQTQESRAAADSRASGSTYLNDSDIIFLQQE
jgi:hypothetical protein